MSDTEVEEVEPVSRISGAHCHREAADCVILKSHRSQPIPHCLSCVQHYSVVWKDDGEQKEQLTLTRDGEGTAKFINGDAYIGEYIAGKRHGQGSYKHANGCQYVGAWDSGLKHGQGTLSYPDKGKYTGGWVAGKRDGYGVYEYKGGDVYSGGWKAGVKSGKGAYKFAVGGEEVKGEWSNGVLVDGSWEQNGSRYLGRFKGPAAPRPRSRGQWQGTHSSRPLR